MKAFRVVFEHASVLVETDDGGEIRCCRQPDVQAKYLRQNTKNSRIPPAKKYFWTGLAAVENGALLDHGNGYIWPVAAVEPRRKLSDDEFFAFPLPSGANQAIN